MKFLFNANDDTYMTFLGENPENKKSVKGKPRGTKKFTSKQLEKKGLFGVYKKK